MGFPAMDYVQIAEKYGGWVLFLAMIAKDIFPAFATKIFPQLQKRGDRELEARIAAEKDEREHRHRMEERTVTAMEQLVVTCQSIKDFMDQVSGKLDKLDTKKTPTRKTRNT